VVLMATGAAFMRWSTDESVQSVESAAAMQAYYLAEMGIVEQGLQYLRGLQAAQLPQESVVFPGREVPDVRGRYSDITVKWMTEQTGGSFFAGKRIYRISAKGTVRVPLSGLARREDEDHYVSRTAVLYVEVRNFVDYMYLSNEERTVFGDWIKFWHGDTLQGRVHSNSQIAIMENPVFYELVTSTARDFWRGSSYNPVFLGPPPAFRARGGMIPNEAENLRIGAAQQGMFLSFPGQTTYARFDRSAVVMWHWPTGAPMDSSQRQTIPITDSTCIFIDGPLELHGLVQGQVTIGASGTIRIMDNIRYVDADARTGITPETSRNILGIVSEEDIKVANTPANGRENSAGGGENQTNPDLTDVVITGAIVALGESFTFENQNDPDSGYVCIPCPGDGQDDRGTIYVFGSITQMRRGYVHRSNLGSTGYLKQYRYDRRLLLARPPCFFNATDTEGRALFNLVQWGRGAEWDPRYPLRYN